jgi:hypothetical protein
VGLEWQGLTTALRQATSGIALGSLGRISKRASRSARPQILQGEHLRQPEKKQREKLDYMHNNPVMRKLVSTPGEWPWSSWRYYFLEDASMIAMDHLE